MPRRIVMVLGAITVAVFSACSLGQPSNKPAAVGDTCLVGTWTLDLDTNSSGYTFNGVPVPVTGLQGAKLTVTAAGDERESFEGSLPLIGHLADGRELRIMIGGSLDFNIHAASHEYVETGTSTALPTTATIAGASISDYHSSYMPGSGTYTCSRQSLTVTTSSNVQTDTWSKG
jgi:hypothetical protein